MGRPALGPAHSWAGADRCGSVEVVAQQLGPGRVAQFGDGSGLDLADPLVGNAVRLADMVEGLGWPSVRPYRIDAERPSAESQQMSQHSTVRNSTQ
jgi:hypothetical protein